MLIWIFPPQFLKEMSVSKRDYFIAELLPAYSQAVMSISKRQNSSFNTEKATSFFQIVSCFLHPSTCFLFPLFQRFLFPESIPRMRNSLLSKSYSFNGCATYCYSQSCTH